MIRIDEIYYNIFLPALQHRKGTTLHWFDPFGTTNFENMCTKQSVEWYDIKHRIIFWDQEPLHRDNVKKFWDLFVKQRRHSKLDIAMPHTLVTSEYQSEDVDWTCNTYDLKTAYYFFHGWAALDWFRGYNRSFLIKPPEQRQINKTFIMPNRIIAGRRQHRLLMLYHIVKHGMTNNHISFPKVCPAEKVSVKNLASKFIETYSDILSVLDQQPLPLNFAGESDHPMHSYKLSLFDQASESLLYLVSETVASGRKQHLTEKSFKPICLQMPFILIGTAGSLEYLRKYGFKTFGHLWDESYDQEVNDLQRLEKISWVLKGLDSCSAKEKQNIFKNAQQVCQHNYEHFYGGEFERILWQELSLLVKQLDV